MRNCLAHSDESGFTVSEVLVVVILTAALTLIIMLFTFDLWRTSAITEASNDTLVTRFTAGDVLRDEIGTSAGLIIQNGLADANTLVPDPSIAGNNYWLPIHAVPGTTSVGANGTYAPLIYFRRFSTNSSGQFIMNGSQPYEDQYILYLNGTSKSVMQRVLANPSATGNQLKTSCPPAVATASCPADKVIASDVSSVSTRYFSRTGNTVNHNSITDPTTGQYIGPDFPAVEVVELTFNFSKKPAFSDTNATSSSTVIRAALRNSS